LQQRRYAVAMIRITPEIIIDANELQMEFIRSSGPGGQNVNKVSTAVQLRFDVINSVALPEDVKARLISLAGDRMTGQGVLIINARQRRSQQANREDAVKRLTDMIREAALKPKNRRKTKPTKASQIKRLAIKRKRSETKKLRQRPAVDEN
jgi:ribosome-associated protein